LPLSERLEVAVTPERRLNWLASRLSRLQVKTCTLDPVLDHAARIQERARGVNGWWSTTVAKSRSKKQVATARAGELDAIESFSAVNRHSL